MFLASGPFLELTGFLQIVGWIAVPSLIISIAATWIFHYRKKKTASPDLITLTDTGTNTSTQKSTKPYHIFFDHTGLLRQYKNKLTYSIARYTALRSDYDQLKSSLNQTSSAGSEAGSPDWSSEKIMLHQRIEWLDQSCKNLQLENESLLEQLQIRSATADEKIIIVNSWKEENVSLKIQLERLRHELNERNQQLTQTTEKFHFLRQQVSQSQPAR